jgi:ankyrin repeat protein
MLTKIRNSSEHHAENLYGTWRNLYSDSLTDAWQPGSKSELKQPEKLFPGVNNRDELGQTALILAARNGQKGIVEILCEKFEADLDEVDNSGKTALQ